MLLLSKTSRKGKGSDRQPVFMWHHQNYICFKKQSKLLLHFKAILFEQISLKLNIKENCCTYAILKNLSQFTLLIFL
jgi:hypothetical protein